MDPISKLLADFHPHIVARAELSITDKIPPESVPLMRVLAYVSQPRRSAEAIVKWELTIASLIKFGPENSFLLTFSP